MKKILYTLLVGAMVLSACNESSAPIEPKPETELATFQIEVPATTPKTPTTPTTPTPVAKVTRYIVEAYEGKDLTTTPVRVEAATGSLTLELKKNTDYTFVFWADSGTANTAIATSGDYFDATTLQSVKVNPSAYATVGTPAYALALSFNSKDFEANKTVVLKYATAQINFIESARITTADNSLTVKYSSGGKLNVATGVITEIGAEIPRTFSNIGMVARNGIVVSDHILVPMGEKRLLDLKVTFNSGTEKTITGVPFQQNYKTKVKGEFGNSGSSEFTVSSVSSSDPDVEVQTIRVGDFCYQDKTFSSIYTANDQNPCIGIVFLVNADGMTGKIMSLDDTKNIKWSTELIVTGATSQTDGAANTTKVLALDSYTAETYPGFAWCAAKNTPAVEGINWYIPAISELRDGIRANKAILRTSLALVDGADELWNAVYKSSTEYGAQQAEYVNLATDISSSSYKTVFGGGAFRAVSAF